MKKKIICFVYEKKLPIYPAFPAHRKLVGIMRERANRVSMMQIQTEPISIMIKKSSTQ